MPPLESTFALAAYEPALIAFAVLCFSVVVQAFLTAPLAFVSEEQVPGMPLRGDHSMLSFRVLRTHANSVETLPVFGFSLAVAVIAGVGATAVNWLAGIHVASRLAFWLVYYTGVGQVAGGPRTGAYVVSALTTLILISLAIFALWT